MEADNALSSVPALPQIPGNYPKDFLNFIQKNGNGVYQALHESPNPGTILAFDMRNFTRTVESIPSRLINIFLDDFFEEISLRIQKIPNGYVNKYLGDGLLAHFDDINPVQAVELAFDILQAFQVQKKKNRLDFIGLTQVVSREFYYKGTIGRTNYIDYTIIGKNINRVFRLVDEGKGDCIYITEQLFNSVNDRFIALNPEFHILDGIGHVIASHLVFRPKKQEEIDQVAINVCENTCVSYKYCYEAWVAGKNGKSYIDCNLCFTQTHPDNCNCNFCKTRKHPTNCSCADCREVRHCREWEFCQIKWKAGLNRQPQKCCHVCSNFRNCYHNFIAGKTHMPMIKC